MGVNSIKFKSILDGKISAMCNSASNLQKDRLDDALRTYASWLVRAARREMAESEASETPHNSARIDLTPKGIKCTNSLGDNGIGRNEGNPE